ncbi:MAG: hypothetical protein AB1925_15710 [Actinomycetota bacterium]
MTRVPHQSFVPAGIETLPAGWVNVRLWSYDEALGRELYVTEPCPGILHFESRITEHVIQKAGPDGELFDQYGEPYDHHPVVVDTEVADPPHRFSQFVDPTWQVAHLGGGYLGTCTTDTVGELLAEHGFAEAIPRGDR